MKHKTKGDKDPMLTREELVALDKKLVWHPYTPMKRYIEETDPVVVDRAEGIYLYDRDGSKLIDCNASWWVNLLGHNHPRLMEALRRQTEVVAHCSLADIVHEPAVRLAQKLLPLCGSSYSRIFYSDNGTTSVEVALRMAYQYWQNVGRPEKRRFVSLSRAFHGETIGAASVSGMSVFHGAIGPLLFDCIRLPSPSASPRDSDGEWYDEAFSRAGRILEQGAGEIAAVIVEPLVQGAAGMLMYPPEYLSRLIRLCRELDILVIADEVFVGYGRTGKFLAQHWASAEADIVCLAKGFSGGVLPFAGTVASDRVFGAFLGGPKSALWYGHSFTGNPLGCAVGIEVLNILEEEKIIEELGPKCEAVQLGLDNVSAHPWVRSARRTGIIAAFDLATPGSNEAEPDYLNELGRIFSKEARKRGALIRPLGNAIYFVLPLTVTVSEIQQIFDIVGRSLDAALPA